MGCLRRRTHAGVQGDSARQPREEAELEVVGMPRKALVLDANILIRAVLGQRVRRIVELHDALRRQRRREEVLDRDPCAQRRPP
jgi:hypothetical protein